MKFLNIEGRTISVSLEHAAKSKRPQRASTCQSRVREALKIIFQSVDIYEDFYVDGLYLDFFIPTAMLAIEVDGSQHEQFNKFFHKTGAGFSNHIRRDERKKEFCEINDIVLIRIAEKDTCTQDSIFREIQNELEC